MSSTFVTTNLIGFINICSVKRALKFKLTHEWWREERRKINRGFPTMGKTPTKTNVLLYKWQHIWIFLKYLQTIQIHTLNLKYFLFLEIRLCQNKSCGISKSWPLGVTLTPTPTPSITKIRNHQISWKKMLVIPTP